jgi:hypothetical protein
VWLTAAALSPFLWWYVQTGAAHVNFPNTNFFKLWIAGYLTGIGGNPYSAHDWLNGHRIFGLTWIPEPVFLYPLSLAYLLIPIGSLSLPLAYSVWAFLSLLATTLSLFLLIDLWEEDRLKIFALPMMVAVFFFAPVLEAPGKGTVGGFLLFAMVLTVYLLRSQRWLAGGMLSAILLVKPTFGIPALILLGFWLLSRRAWLGAVGIVAGGLLFYGIGAVADPQWPVVFLRMGQTKVGEYLGLRPTVLNLAGLACHKGVVCSYGLGLIASGFLLFMAIRLFFHKDKPLAALEAMSLVLTVALLITPYLWSYDFILLIIPVSFIVHELILYSASYWVPISFLIALDVLAFLGLYLQGQSQFKDLWNIVLPFIILVLLIWLIRNRLAKIPSESNRIKKTA